MADRCSQGVPGVLGSLALGLWVGAIATSAAPAAGAEPTEPRPLVATASFDPFVSVPLPAPPLPPFLMTEIHRDLPYSAPVPIVGGVGVELE